MKNRREFLQLGLSASAFLLVPSQVRAFIPDISHQERTLSFYNTHTGERADRVTFFSDGVLIPESLATLNHILRDHRTDEIADIDAALFPLIADLSDTLAASGPINIISGYRSPQTNARLAQNSSGVAKKSYHTRGMAIDLQIPGRDLKSIQKAALIIGSGGVGYYPESGFIHLDTGPKRNWQGK